MGRRFLGLAVVAICVGVAGGSAIAGRASHDGCRLSELQVSLGPEISPETGQNPFSFVFRNVGRRACVLDGYPTVAVLGRDDRQLPFLIGRGGLEVTGRLPRPIRLLPSQRAYIVMSKYRCDVVTTSRMFGKSLMLGVPNDSGSVTFGRPVYPYCGDGDPGSIVNVSPFEATLRAAESF